jgi:hypothetical protein
MTSKKLHLYLSALSISFVFVGTIFASDNIVFWMSSSSLVYEVVRATLLILLIVQMFTNPPRHPGIRLGAGIIALSILYWATAQTYNMTMPLMDTLLFIGSSIVVGVTAIEMGGLPQDQKLLPAA